MVKFYNKYLKINIKFYVQKDIFLFGGFDFAFSG
jgi:hypothetical protein